MSSVVANITTMATTTVNNINDFFFGIFSLLLIVGLKVYKKKWSYLFHYVGPVHCIKSLTSF